MSRRAELQRLQAELAALDAAPLDAFVVDWSALPAPVARYLRRALASRPRAPRRLTLHQHGRLRMAPGARRWLPFTSTQQVAPAGPGFVWDARVRVAPGLHVAVLDALIGARAQAEVRLLSVWRIGHDAGTPELHEGALHRFLAEAVWYPWALLPRPALSWQALDARRALATLRAGAGAVALEFRFGAEGEVTGVHTPARWGRFGGSYRQLAWEGRFADWHDAQGVWMPRRGEVGWYHEGRLEPVWQGEIAVVSPGNPARSS